MKINLNNNDSEIFWVYFNNVKWDTEVEGEILDSEYLGLTPNQMVHLEKSDFGLFKIEGISPVDVEGIVEVALETLSDNAGYCVRYCKVDRIVYVNETTEERLTITVDKYF